MKKDKIRAKLSKLEQALENKKYNDHFVFIPALSSETDEEAVRARIGHQQHTDYYTIYVFRRLGAGLKFTIYDQTMQRIIRTDIHDDITVYEASSELSKEEVGILLSYFNRELYKIEGRDWWGK